MPNIKRAATSGLTKTGTAIPDVPDAPTVGAPSDVGTSRAYNNGAATVAITAAATGGTPSSYTVTSSPGNFTGSGTSPVTVTGLQSATSYTFTATGTNATATGPASAASAAVTATTVPQAPTIGTVSVTNSTTVSIPFTAGATGGKTISSYTTTSSPSISLSTSGTSSPLTATGSFAVGQAYTFTIAAVNANGTSTSSSASNSVIPNVSSFFTYLSTGLDFRGAYCNSDGIYAVGRTSTGTDALAVIVRFNYDGTVNWQRTLDKASQRDFAYAVTGDSSGNIYVGGRYHNDATDAQANFLVKYNSAGTLQYRKRMDTAVTVEYITGMVINSSNEIYAGAVRSTVEGMLLKFDTTPTASWSRYFNVSDEGAVTDSRVTLDSSGNAYITTAGRQGSVASPPYWTAATIRKFNSSGTVQARRDLDISTQDAIVTFTDVSTGTNLSYSDNIYAVGNYNGVAMLLKLDTSLNLSWARQINCLGANAVTVSAAGDIYVAAAQSATNDRRITLFKYDSSGTLQWQRRIDTNTGVNTQDIFALTINESQARLIGVGQVGGNVFTFLLPLDGSGTGTYTVGSYSLVYDTPTLTSSTLTITLDSPSATAATVTNTISDTTQFSGATSTYTANTNKF